MSTYSNWSYLLIHKYIPVDKYVLSSTYISIYLDADGLNRRDSVGLIGSQLLMFATLTIVLRFAVLF